MQANNVLTWVRAGIIEALVGGFKMDFSRMLIVKIHERTFKATITYLFPCLIF